jgi:uncharacterized membrane protein
MTLVWNNALPWPLIVLIGVLIAAALFFSYRKPRREIPAPTRAGLFGMRIVVLAILLALLGRPTLEGRSATSEENRITILVDASRSMTVRDEGTKTRIEALREAWQKSQGALKELSAIYRISTLRFGSEVRESKDLAFEPTDDRTSIGSALADAAGRTGPGALEHVVVISDGQNNGGRDPVGAAKAVDLKGIRVHAVTLGKPPGASTAPRVIARGAHGPEEVMTGRSFELTAEFHATAGQGQYLMVDLLIDGAPVATEQAAIQSGLQSLTVRFTHQFAEEGSHLLAFTARPLQGEQVAPDQTAFLPIKVRKKVLEVLYVEGQIRDEFKYLRRSLSKFSDLKLSTVLTQTPEPGQEALPRDASGWMKYDVVLLGDLPAAALSEGQRSGLEEAVRKGLGFVMIGGFDNFGAGGYAGTPVADLLPVRIDAKEQKTEELFAVEPTGAGLESPVMRLASDPGKNAELWRSLPRLKGYAVAVEKKRGETVLARGPAGAAMLVAQEYGSGRSMAFMADTTWRWWRSVGGREDLHKRFWRQLVLWLAHRDGRGEGSVRLKLPKPVYEPGEAVRMRAEVLDGGREPVEGATLRTTLEGPDGKKIPVRLDPEPGGYGESITPTVPGKYRIEVSAEKEKVSMGQDAVDFMVQAVERELRVPYANLELMKQVADAGHGRCVDLEGLPGLLQKLRADYRPVRIESSVSKELWNSPWILALFWAFLAGEWFIRRWKGFF